MPAKATLYNTKCESIYDFGTGPRNAVHINPHGNSKEFLVVTFALRSFFSHLLGGVWKLEGESGTLIF